MIYGRLDAITGMLSDIAYRDQQFPDDVPLVAMPSGEGPYGYDATNHVATIYLPAYRQVKIDAIDARTESLLEAGFAFSPSDGSGSSNFGIGAAQQSTWLGMLISAASLTYPLAIGTVDDRVVYLGGAAEVQAFYSAAVVRAGAILTGGITLRASAQAATTQTAIDAITDART